MDPSPEPTTSGRCETSSRSSASEPGFSTTNARLSASKPNWSPTNTRSSASKPRLSPTNARSPASKRGWSTTNARSPASKRGWSTTNARSSASKRGWSTTNGRSSVRRPACWLTSAWVVDQEGVLLATSGQRRRRGHRDQRMERRLRAWRRRDHAVLGLLLRCQRASKCPGSRYRHGAVVHEPFGLQSRLHRRNRISCHVHKLRRTDRGEGLCERRALRPEWGRPSGRQLDVAALPRLPEHGHRVRDHALLRWAHPGRAGLPG
jgi:hypothetical protein